MLRLLAAEWNSLGIVDIIFFAVCALIIVAIVLIYFLIPVINKKQYQEQRDNLKKREIAFKANLITAQNENAAADATPSENEQNEENSQA